MKNRRRPHLASKLHRKHVLRFSMLTFVFTFVLFAFLLGPPYIMMTHGGISEEATLAAQEFLYLSLKVIPFVLVLVVALIVLEACQSHKFYGPLVRLNRWLEDLSNGYLHDRGPFRKKDILQEEAKRFNEALRHLREPLEEVQHVLQSSESPEEKLEKIEEILSFYKF